MDVPVSRLNQRMALQLPAEFPLGLVFVVGEIGTLEKTAGDDGRSDFYLVEGEHRIRCRLSQRAETEISLKEGEVIRAGGHLAFDASRADYYLLARDVEVLPDRRREATLSPTLADVQMRSQAARLAPADLPPWVKQIAPPEVQVALGQKGPAAGEAGMAPAFTDESEMGEPAAEPRPGELPEDLFKFLSEAMDSPEEVELTPELVAELAPANQPNQTHDRRTQSNSATAAQPAGSMAWIVAGVVFTVLFLFLALIVILALLATSGF